MSQETKQRIEFYYKLAIAILTGVNLFVVPWAVWTTNGILEIQGKIGQGDLVTEKEMNERAALIVSEQQQQRAEQMAELERILAGQNAELTTQLTQSVRKDMEAIRRELDLKNQNSTTITNLLGNANTERIGRLETVMSEISDELEAERMFRAKVEAAIAEPKKGGLSALFR